MMSGCRGLVSVVWDVDFKDTAYARLSLCSRFWFILLGCFRISRLSKYVRYNYGTEVKIFDQDLGFVKLKNTFRRYKFEKSPDNLKPIVNTDLILLSYTL